jgi:hypothetical protein
MRAAAMLVLVVLLSGCGSTDSPESSESTTAQSASAPIAATSRDAASEAGTALPRLARDLIPDKALRSVSPGELKLEECGITPTFPCTNVFFAFGEGRGVDARIHSLTALATSKGWRVERVKRFAAGAYVNLVRGEYHARYAIERSLAPDGTSLVQVQVYGPAVELPQPSAAEQRQWSQERRGYVRRANAICAQTLGRLRDPDDLSRVLAELSERLAVLKSPPREAEEVQRFLRPLRNLARAARALQDEQDEGALPAAVAVGEFTKRFVAAASGYGLTECTLG